MDHINLNANQALKILSSKNFISEGVEGKIYRIPGSEHILIKIYHNLDVPENFAQKVEAFHNLKDIDDIIARPLQLLTLNNIPIGHTMLEYGVSLDNINVSFEERVNILEQCKDIIERLHQKGIIIGDIKLQNFLYKDGKVKMCDVCNSKIGPYDINVKNTITKFHENKRRIIDENTDIQAFNYMTYVFLKYGMVNMKNKKFVHDFDKILSFDLQVHGIPNYYDTEAYDIIKNIYEISDTKTNEFLLNYVKKQKQR